MAARRFGSRTTTKTQGWRFSALGANVAASRTFSTAVVVDPIVTERPTCPLTMHHLDDVFHEPHATARGRRRRDSYGAMVAAVPMMIRGCAAGFNQRSTGNSSPVGSDTHPTVGPPSETWRKMALPAPGTVGFML